MVLPLAAHTFGTLYRYTLSEALSALAAAGYRRVELAATPPHAYTPTFGAEEIGQLRGQLRALGLTCCSVTPTFSDLNLASPNEAVRALSVGQVKGSMQLAVELDAPIVVLIPGRRHPLVPQPVEAARVQFRRSLDELAGVANKLGIVVGLENFASGIADTGRELAGVADEYHGQVCVVYDVANATVVEDPVAGLRDCARVLGLVHVSDSRRAQWGHMRIGAGEVDFPAVASTLREIDYRGLTVYELLQSDDPVVDMGCDALKLEALGWSR